MTVYLAADHAGFELKRLLSAHLASLGHEVSDLGAEALVPEDDYPDFVTPLARRVAEESRANTPDGLLSVAGIVIGGSGQGEAMAANRVEGVRAALYYGPGRALSAVDAAGDSGKDGHDIVRLARLHNDANVLSLGARFVSPEDANAVAELFLATSFSGEARHRRRLAKF